MPNSHDLLGRYYAAMSDDELQDIGARAISFAPHILRLVARELSRRGITPSFAVPGEAPQAKPKPIMPTAARIHCALLGAVRSYRHWRFRLFHGRTPQWFTDITGVVGYVNFLQLLPTLSAIALVPDRFAMKISELVDGKHPLYLGPVKYISTWISLILIIPIFAGISGGNRLTVWLSVLLISLLSPIWITLYLMCVQFIIFLSKRFENCRENILPVVFSLDTYNALSGRLLFWQLTYFGGYLSAGVLVCGALVYLAFEIVTTVFGSDGRALRLAVLAMCPAGIWGAAFLIMPQWIAVLRNSVRSPTRKMIRTDVMEAAYIAYMFFEREKAGETRMDDLRTKLIFMWPRIRTGSASTRAAGQTRWESG